MRVTVWCLACALIACGKSGRSGDARDQGVVAGAPAAGRGGRGASSSGAGGVGLSGGDGGDALASGTAGTGGVSSGGTGGNDAGGRQASGAGGTSAGNATSAGSGGGDAGTHASAGDGGSSGDSEVGSAGAAGAAPAECGGEYVACGCGCCGGTTPNTVCYYPDRGESLGAIERDDQSAAMSPSCAGAGCAIGLDHVCCAIPSEPPPAMSQRVTGGMVPPDIYRVSLYRTGTDARCQVAHFARGEGPGDTAFPIALPDGWILEMIEDYLCADESSQSPSSRREALGAVGALGFSGTSGECRVKFDFTAFFASSSGSVDAVQFESDWQSSPVVPECG